LPFIGKFIKKSFLTTYDSNNQKYESKTSIEPRLLIHTNPDPKNIKSSQQVSLSLVKGLKNIPFFVTKPKNNYLLIKLK